MFNREIKSLLGLTVGLAKSLCAVFRSSRKPMCCVSVGLVTSHNQEGVGDAMTWQARLLRASKNGGFTEEDKAMAGMWPTCAIGERYHITSSLGDALAAKGVTSTMALVGFDFMYAVNDNDLDTAIKLYDEIQLG